MDFLCIIQARTNSTRLPKKVLMPLGDKIVLQHVIERVKRSKRIDETIIATTISKEDLPIVRLCCDMGIRVFCGSEEDVLDRYYQVAKIIRPKNIVRVTSDCPVIDSTLIDEMISVFLKTEADYSWIENYPDGLDAEVFKFEALEDAWLHAKLNSEREHVTPYINNRDNVLKKISLKSDINFTAKRWTLDEERDYEFLKIIFDNLYYENNNFNYKEILSFINENPEIENINCGIIRNEGYFNSLLKDNV